MAGRESNKTSAYTPMESILNQPSPFPSTPNKGQRLVYVLNVYILNTLEIERYLVNFNFFHMGGNISNNLQSTLRLNLHLTTSSLMDVEFFNRPNPEQSRKF